MPNSVVTAVLDMEREAEAILKKAGADVERVLADAKAKREAAAKESEDKVKREVARIEAEALRLRESKSKELAAKGESALAAVRNISDAAFDGGVRHILDALSNAK